MILCNELFRLWDFHYSATRVNTGVVLFQAPSFLELLLVLYQLELTILPGPYMRQFSSSLSFSKTIGFFLFFRRLPGGAFLEAMTNGRCQYIQSLQNLSIDYCRFAV